MLVVRIELHNANTPGTVEEIGTMVITNDGTGTNQHGNYDVYVAPQGVTDPRATMHLPQKHRRVQGHRRTCGAWYLVRRACSAL